MGTPWTTQNIPDLTGQIALVTGANSGIGYEAARALAGKCARVIMTCRSLEKGTVAVNQIYAEYPNATIDLMELDLASLESVRDFAQAFTSRYNTLHYLLNNAGVMALPKRYETADGFEMQFGTNHLGHFALTGLLLDVILRTPKARVVTVSSGAHRMGRIDFDDLNAEKSYSSWGAYGQSKLANLLFTYELQRKFAAAGADAIATAAHPGYTATNLQAHSGIFRFLNPLFAQTPEMGTLPTLYGAFGVAKGGEFYGPDRFFGWRGYPMLTTSSQQSYDEAVAARLWEVSEELTGVRYTALESRITA